MKVLLLGTGKLYEGIGSRCRACPEKEYEWIVETAYKAGKLFTLDNEPGVKPDIVATVYNEPWAHKVKNIVGDEFDVIIDEITPIRMRGDYYETEAMELLRQGGRFYGYSRSKTKRTRAKTLWINQ